jgi:hypothetical protein
MNTETIANGTTAHEPDATQEAGASARVTAVFAELDNLKDDLEAELDLVLAKAESIKSDLARIEGRAAAAKPIAMRDHVIHMSQRPRERRAKSPGTKRRAGGLTASVIAAVKDNPGASAGSVLEAVVAQRPKTTSRDIAATLFRLKKLGTVKAKGKRGSMTYSVSA